MTATTLAIIYSNDAVTVYKYMQNLAIIYYLMLESAVFAADFEL
jgi:hypothetical protein